MKLRMLGIGEVRLKIEESETKIAHLQREKSKEDEIQKAEAEKAVWERILHHINKGEIITIDDGGHIHWHQDVPKA